MQNFLSKSNPLSKLVTDVTKSGVEPTAVNVRSEMGISVLEVDFQPAEHAFVRSWGVGTFDGDTGIGAMQVNDYTGPVSLNQGWKGRIDTDAEMNIAIAIGKDVPEVMSRLNSARLHSSTENRHVQAAMQLYRAAEFIGKLIRSTIAQRGKPRAIMWLPAGRHSPYLLEKMAVHRTEIRRGETIHIYDNEDY